MTRHTVPQKKRRNCLFVAFSCCVLFSTALAERGPRPPMMLIDESDLVIVGKIIDLNITSERSHIEQGFGNYDWAIDLTIRVIDIEKGRFDATDRIVARCFRIKSRNSLMEYLSPSGNRPIPDVGAIVRAHLYRDANVWRVVIPNGLASTQDKAKLTDAYAVQQLGNNWEEVCPKELSSVYDNGSRNLTDADTILQHRSNRGDVCPDHILSEIDNVGLTSDEIRQLRSKMRYTCLYPIGLWLLIMAVAAVTSRLLRRRQMQGGIDKL